MTKLAGIAVAALVLSAGSALAGGDARRIPAPIPVPAPMPVPEGFTYYLRGDIGWGFTADPSFSETGASYSGGTLTGRTVSTDDVFHGTIGAGAYITPHLRTDITLDFRGSQEIDAVTTYIDGANTGTARDTIKLRGTVALVNAYWDLLPRGSFSPYIGAGVGVVYNNIERTNLTTDTVPSTVDSGASEDTSWSLAAALMAGFTIARDHTWALDVGYRALYMDGSSITTTLNPTTAGASRVTIGSQWEHQIRVGVRANIW